MRIVSHRKLKDFYSQPGREDAKAPLERWYSIAEEAQWTGLTDIRKDFASMSIRPLLPFILHVPVAKILPKKVSSPYDCRS